ncbi:pentatricopeptide repeat-containing protein At3g07290, mitochondrial [Jatropha curcas]|uniref:pentatricopeptide repeat-containing protein At3g07290, mitochondrial n=1 Tax=Jatropha curcas TaxID=180498 RepID=UPI001894E898|nr:pentatricopeptide repeat-containing protein At3g07290, mitochondrial [Jatropha curcas]
MLIHTTKLTKAPFGPLVFPSQFIFSSVSLISTYNQKNPETVEGTVYLVSSLVNKPNWERNSHLKSLVSHMPPFAVHKIIELHNNNTELGVRFFKWVCKQSTYCYDIDSRIHLLNLIVSSNMFGIAHKVIIALIKECSNSENDMLKLMGSLDELREVGFRLNYPCYSLLLMGLAKVNMGFVAFLVYKKLVADGFVIGRIDYRTIINALCKNGYVQAGEMFLCRVLRLGFDLDTHICTSLVLGYCRERLLSDAFRVFEIMSILDGCEPNSVTLQGEECVLLKAVCDIGLIDKAISLLDEMVRNGCKPNVYTYTALIDGLCREGKIEEANGIFRRMLQDGLSPGIITYNALINGYCKEGRIVSAFEIIGLMERRNCKPNIRTYNELMEGLCRVNKSYKAMFLLKRIVDNGLSPNSVTYNILVDGLCREGQLDVAFKIFRSMEVFGFQPDALTFTALIDGLCKNRKPEWANALFGLMAKSGIPPDEIAFTALMDGYCKIGKTRDALLLFTWMMDHTYLNSSHAFNLFVDVFCKENKLKEEYTMFGKILKYGLVPSVVTYTILVDGQCRAGEINSSLNMLELMKRVGCAPNVYTYTIVINGLCQNGRIQEAESLLSSMFDVGVPPNVITYTTLVKAHANAGRLDCALNIVNTMVKNGCQPNRSIYSALLSGFSLSNKNAEAQIFTHSANLDADCSLSDENDNDCLSSHMLKDIDVELASELADEIERCGVSAAEFYNVLVLRLCREGRMAEADHLIRDKVKFGLFPDKAVSSIIEWHCREKRYDYCLDFMKLILDNGFVPSFTSFCLVIQGLDGEGKIQQAQNLVSDLLRCSGVQEENAILPYIDFLVKGYQSHELVELIDQLHYRERPVI